MGCCDSGRCELKQLEQGVDPRCKAFVFASSLTCNQTLGFLWTPRWLRHFLLNRSHHLAV